MWFFLRVSFEARCLTSTLRSEIESAANSIPHRHRGLALGLVNAECESNAQTSMQTRACLLSVLVCWCGCCRPETGMRNSNRAYTRSELNEVKELVSCQFRTGVRRARRSAS